MSNGGSEKRWWFALGNAEVVVVVDEEAVVPKYPKHLRRLESLLKQPLMLWQAKWVRVRKSVVAMRMIWRRAKANLPNFRKFDGAKWCW